MPLLDGFKVIPLKEKFDDSYLTISEKSLKLNRATAQALGLPKQVVFLLNEKKMQIASMPAKGGDENTVDFSFDETGREKPIYVKEPAILKAMKGYYDVLAEGYERFGFNSHLIELALKEAKEAEEDEIS